MNRKASNLVSYLFIFCFCFWHWNCGPSIAENPGAIAVHYKGVQDNQSFAKLSLKSAGSRVELDRIFLSVGQTTIEYTSRCASNTPCPQGIPGSYDLPYVIDLINDTEIPEAPKIEVTSEVIQSFSIQLLPITSSSAPELIQAIGSTNVGYSLVVEGTYTDNSREVPIRIRSSTERILEINYFLQPTVIEFLFDFSLDKRLLIAEFELNSWFFDINLTAAIQDGRIEINDTLNSNLLDLILFNINQSLRLGQDLNGDGELSPNEQFSLP